MTYSISVCMMIKFFLSFLAGLMADKSGNYMASFLIAGGVGIIACLVPFLLLCIEHVQEPPENIQHICAEEAEDKDQSEDADNNELNAIITDHKENI